METRVAEVGDGIFQLCTEVPDSPVAFNQYLISGDEPVLFHTGHHGLFPTVAEAVARALELTGNPSSVHSFGRAARKAVEDAREQVAALGFNCIAPELADRLLETAAAVTAKPLVLYPNSGERWDAGARRWLPGGPSCDFGTAAPRWHQLGARLIGGCCRTTPDTIRTVRAALAARR